MEERARGKPGRVAGEGKREVLVGPSSMLGLAEAVTDQAAWLPNMAVLDTMRRDRSRALGSDGGRGEGFCLFAPLVCNAATKQLV